VIAIETLYPEGCLGVLAADRNININAFLKKQGRCTVSASTINRALDWIADSR
jgi:hypothetical protein